MRVVALYAVLLVFGYSVGAGAADQPATYDDVIAMMDRVPESEKPHAKPYRWSTLGDAKEIARALASLELSRVRAAELVVNGCFESGLRKSIAGDKDKYGVFHSFGWLQINDRRLPPEQAARPVVAARAWIELAVDSRDRCASLPEDEQLAALMSGNCEHGHAKARHRAAVGRYVLEAPACEPVDTGRECDPPPTP